MQLKLGGSALPRSGNTGNYHSCTVEAKLQWNVRCNYLILADSMFALTPYHCSTGITCSTFNEVIALQPEVEHVTVQATRQLCQKKKKLMGIRSIWHMH